MPMKFGSACDLYVSSDALQEGVERDVMLTTQLSDQTSRTLMGMC